MFKVDIIKSLLNEYSERNKKEEKRVNDLINDLLNKFPEFKNARQNYSSARVRLTLSKLNRESFNFEESEKIYKSELKKVCNKAHISVEELNVRYECKECKDTGFVGDIEKKYCNCLINRMSKEIIKNQNLNEKYSFEYFDINIFPNDKKVDKAGKTQREHIIDIKQKVEKWCCDFPNTKKLQMLVTGKTGVGKSFLVNCIAHSLIEKGYSVANTTASAINEAMFSVINNKDYSLLNLFKHCDLLIVDDLGVEAIINNITSETLYEIIENRITHNKHTIISTNLELKQIQEKYGYRVSSRITSTKNTAGLLICGDDLRTL